jgi:hypothetical protein
MKTDWSPLFTIGWFVFISLFLGLDALAWLTRDSHVPTFSRVVVRLLPWWITMPAAGLLFAHWALMYIRKG